MQPDYDCIVIGAGLVGAAQAIALSETGLKVLALDARAKLGDVPGGDVRGLALAHSSRSILDQLHVWPAIARYVAPVRHIQVSDQGRLGATRLDAADCELEALGYVCPADRLLEAIERVLIDYGEVRWRTRLVGFHADQQGVTLTVEDESGIDTLTARLLIAADGANSHVREQLGVKVKTHRYDQFAVVANLNVERIDAATAIERFTRTGPLALLPLKSGRHVAVRCCAGNELKNLLGQSDALFLSQLEDGFGQRFGRMTALGRRTHHELLLVTATETIGERCVLIGAAANHIHPNGAQGLNLGLRDVAALAASLRDAHARGEDIGSRALLQRFAGARTADRSAVVRFSDTLAQVFASRLPFVPVLRNAAMIALELTPPARRWLIRRAAGLVGESPLAAVRPRA